MNKKTLITVLGLLSLGLFIVGAYFLIQFFTANNIVYFVIGLPIILLAWYLGAVALKNSNIRKKTPTKPYYEDDDEE